MKAISREEIGKLENVDKQGLTWFLKKKFDLRIDIKKQLEVKIPQKVRKRNEEFFKFVLKGFFKFLCKKNKETYSGQTFFQIKKKVSQEILNEIGEALHLQPGEFWGKPFVDDKNFILRGNKFFPLYQKSTTFR